MLSVCEGGSVVTLDQAETRGGLHIVSDVGSRLPLYCTSQGKVFLANMSRAGAEALLRAQPMTQFTPHTVTDPSALMREIETCRKRGYVLLSVGVDTDDPIKHGLDTVRLDRIEDVRAVVDHLGSRLLKL